MQNRFFDVDLYDSIMKSKITTLSVIAVALTIVFGLLITYSIVEIRENIKAKIKYVQLFVFVVIYLFLIISLILQIFGINKDFVAKNYVQYEGLAKINTERFTAYGALPTSYEETVIRFEYGGEHIKLSTEKRYPINQENVKIYIVYSENSKVILDLEILE